MKRKMTLGGPATDEQGIAMILAIIITTLVIAFGAIALGISNTSLGDSSEHVTFENAVHLAEQGVDQSLARLQQYKDANYNYYTTTETVSGDERAWAKARLEAATTEACSNTVLPSGRPAWAVEPASNTACLSDGPEGQFAVVKPRDQKVVYAGAWVPSKADPKKFRMLKVDYLFSSYRPAKGILTGGDLELQGAAGFSITGGVHSNANVVQNGSPTVSGGLTASGTCVSPCVGGQPRETLPVIEPLQLWLRQKANFTRPLPAEGDWYDLCPDGLIRRPDGASPCDPAATRLFSQADSGPSAKYLGWSYSSVVNKWSKDNDPSYRGIFYVRHSNVDLKAGTGGGVWEATVITDGALKPSQTCQKDNGDIDVGGSPRMVPFPGMGAQLVAGRDLQISGTAGASLNGLLAAQEQVSLSGTAQVVGAVIAEDRCDTPSPNPLVHKNFMGGSFNLSYAGGLDVLLGGLIRTTLWLEL